MMKLFRLPKTYRFVGKYGDAQVKLFSVKKRGEVQLFAELFKRDKWKWKSVGSFPATLIPDMERATQTCIKDANKYLTRA